LVHNTPELVVTVMLAALPTATQLLTSLHTTPTRAFVPTFDVCAAQFVPPLVVRMIMPLAPTAKHVVLDGQLDP
jgi:hypothetical protein